MLLFMKGIVNKFISICSFVQNKCLRLTCYFFSCQTGTMDSRNVAHVGHILLLSLNICVLKKETIASAVNTPRQRKVIVRLY